VRVRRLLVEAAMVAGGSGCFWFGFIGSRVVVLVLSRGLY
jgi:hypothetical protein